MGELQTMSAPPSSLPSTPAVERPTGVPRVALVDSDSGFLQVLAKRLSRLGWAFSVNPAVGELPGMRLSAIVVDPESLGSARWDFLESVGRDASEVALVVCTGPSSVAERVRGLHLGADDWVTKPCHPEEVIARIDAILRRRSQATSRIMSGASVAGEVQIRTDRFQAYVADRSLDLTRREFELLRLLAGAVGKVLTREEIYQQVWGYQMAHGDRSVDVFVRKLRLKLERNSPTWAYIHTHFGVGYRFEPVLKGD